jgi:glycosyltransferase involved in cell wall biosynthesis
VLPLIRARAPDAQFRVIGRNPAPAVRALAALPGVAVVGQVPDVRPHVARAAVVVAPLRIARGVQNKVLEAMALAKAVIASPAALAALRTEDGVHLVRASAPAEWADAAVALLAHPARRAELGRAARAYVDAHHHWERCLKPLADAVFQPASEP